MSEKTMDQKECANSSVSTEEFTPKVSNTDVPGAYSHRYAARPCPVRDSRSFLLVFDL